MFKFNSWYLLHVSNITCSSPGRPFVHAVLCGMFFIHLCKQYARWKESSTTSHLLECLHKCVKNIPYKTACRNGLPGDEHMMFETCKRLQELNWNINLRSVYLFTINQRVYSVKYTTIAHDICILLWQHVSVHLRPSSVQRSYAKIQSVHTMGSHTTYIVYAKAIKNIKIFKG